MYSSTSSCSVNGCLILLLNLFTASSSTPRFLIVVLTGDVFPPALSVVKDPSNLSNIFDLLSLPIATRTSSKPNESLFASTPSFSKYFNCSVLPFGIASVTFFPFAPRTVLYALINSSLPFLSVFITSIISDAWAAIPPTSPATIICFMFGTFVVTFPLSSTYLSVIVPFILSVISFPGRSFPPVLINFPANSEAAKIPGVNSYSGANALCLPVCN